MKQGKSYFTVILWILLAAIAAYFGYHVISSLYAPLMTATVTPYEAGAATTPPALSCVRRSFYIRSTARPF